MASSHALTHEIADTVSRTQVVCPGMVATEFNNGSGHHVPFSMTPESVAHASLAALQLGETCIPGLENQPAALAALLAAETTLLTGGNRPTPAAGYTNPHLAEDAPNHHTCT